MAVIKSGATSDQMTVDATSKAARVTPYDTLGNNRGAKKTYRAASAAPFAAPNGTTSFFTIFGSGTKTIRIQRIRVSGLTLTAVTYIGVVVNKFSTAVSGGTATTLTQVPLDSGNAAGTATNVKSYTAAPTDGTLVGPIAQTRTLGQATTAAASGIPDYSMEFDFRAQGESEPPVLRGTGEGLGLAFAAAPGSAVTLGVEVEWTEE